MSALKWQTFDPLNATDKRYSVSSSAAHTHAKESHRSPCAVVWHLHGGIASVPAGTLLISGLSACDDGKQLAVLEIVRFELTSDLGMLKGSNVISCPVVCKGAVIVPDPAALVLRDLLQNIQTFSVVAILDILSC